MCQMTGLCSSPLQASYEVMRDALNATGRPILYSLCSWGSGEPHKWGQQVRTIGEGSWAAGPCTFGTWGKAHGGSEGCGRSNLCVVREATWRRVEATCAWLGKQNKQGRSSGFSLFKDKRSNGEASVAFRSRGT